MISVRLVTHGPTTANELGKERKIRRTKERSISGCSAFLFVWSTYTTWLEYEKTAKGAVEREKKRRKNLESRVLACSSSSPFFSYFFFPLFLAYSPSMNFLTLSRSISGCFFAGSSRRSFLRNIIRMVGELEPASRRRV